MSWRWQTAQFFEIRWWRNYLKGKSPEEYLDWKRRYWTDFLNKCGYLPPPGLSVLDAGCGPAGVFTVLKKNPVTAVDPLLEFYEKELAPFDRGRFPWVRFECRTVESLPGGPTYDAVFCLNAVNHMADWDAALDALVRHLKPGGTLVLSVDVHRFPFLKHLFRRLPGDVLHPQQHELNDYTRWLSREKLKPLRTVRLKREFLFDYWVLVYQKT